MFIVLKRSNRPERGFRLSLTRQPSCALVWSCCLALVISTVCQGAAFSINELGVRAAGMGTAFIGKADDGSALFYNPAGIAFQSGMHLEADNPVVVGLFRYTPSATPVGQVVPANGYSQNIKPHFIPLAALYATKEISPKLTIGFGFFTPFGLSANSTNFNDSDPNLTKFVGRFAGTRVRLESYWFQPTIAYRVSDRLAIAIGPTIVHNHLELEQSILNPLGYDDGLKFGRTAASTIFPGVPVNLAAPIISRLLPEGRARIAGTGNAPGISAGLLWKHPQSKTNIGLMFRSPVVTHLSGKASFAFGTDYPLLQYVGPNFLPNAFPNQAIKGMFLTPATYGVGLANSKFWNTTFAVDVRMQDYKKFKTVPLDFSINEDTVGLKNIALPAQKTFNFNFRESWQIALGAEKPLNASNTFRIGYLFDGSPVPEQSVGPLFPDSTRNSFTVGASHKSGNMEFTFFYEAMKFKNRQTNVAANNYQWTNGEYNNFAHVFGLSLRIHRPNRGDRP